MPHSATARHWLEHGGVEHDLRSVGPGMFHAGKPCRLPREGTGLLCVEVDGRIKRERVRFGRVVDIAEQYKYTRLTTNHEE